MLFYVIFYFLPFLIDFFIIIYLYVWLLFMVFLSYFKKNVFIVYFCPFTLYYLITLISFLIYRKEFEWDCSCNFLIICLFVCRSLLLSYLEGGIWVKDLCYFMLRFYLPFIIDLFVVIIFFYVLSLYFTVFLSLFYLFIVYFHPFSLYYLIILLSFLIYRKECEWDCNCNFLSICLFVCTSVLLSYLEGEICIKDSCYFLLRFFLPFIIDLFVIIIFFMFCCCSRCFFNFFHLSFIFDLLLFII